MVPVRGLQVSMARVVLVGLASLAVILSGCQPVGRFSPSASTAVAEMESTLSAQAPSPTSVHLPPTPLAVKKPGDTPIPIPDTATPQSDGHGKQPGETPAGYESGPGTSSTDLTVQDDPGKTAIYSCLIDASVSTLEVNVQPGQVFDTVWSVFNTGNRTWIKGIAQYAYLRGTPLQIGKGALALPKSVAPGQPVELVVAMQAPDQAGNYTSYWSLLNGPEIFCTLEIHIKVQE